VGCHLCEEAKTAIAPLLRQFSATLREIDIEGDATLMERFGCDIPVIYIGRKKAAKHRVNLEQFRRQLEDASWRAGSASSSTVLSGILWNHSKKQD
jgi:Glutaredoxin-like domain (DUF836)